MTPQEAVSKAVGIVGSQAALAKRINVKPPTIHQWLNARRPVPPGRAIEIERVTGGAVSRRWLCPSFPWDEAV